MLSSATPVLFLATADPARAQVFYEEVLELPFIADEPFALVFKSGTSILRIQKVAEVDTPPYTSLGWVVADVPGTVARLVERGVVFARYPWMEQDAAGVWTAPGGTRVAWFRDPDGNLLSISSG